MVSSLGFEPRNLLFRRQASYPLNDEEKKILVLKELVENSSAPYQEAVLTVELHEQIWSS